MTDKLHHLLTGLIEAAETLESEREHFALTKGNYEYHHAMLETAENRVIRMALRVATEAIATGRVTASGQGIGTITYKG